MSELKRILPQLRLAGLLSAMMLLTTAGSLGDWLFALEDNCEEPKDITEIRIFPPLVRVFLSQPKIVMAESRSGQTYKWELTGETKPFPVSFGGAIKVELVGPVSEVRNVDLRVSFVVEEPNFFFNAHPAPVSISVKATFPPLEPDPKSFLDP